MCQRTGLPLSLTEASLLRRRLRLDVDLRELERDQGWPRQRAIAEADRPHPAAGREDEAASLRMLVAVVGRLRPAADDQRDVVVSSQAPLRIEVEGLPLRVGVD